MNIIEDNFDTICNLVLLAIIVGGLIITAGCSDPYSLYERVDEVCNRAEGEDDLVLACEDYHIALFVHRSDRIRSNETLRDMSSANVDAHALYVLRVDSTIGAQLLEGVSIDHNSDHQREVEMASDSALQRVVAEE